MKDSLSKAQITVRDYLFILFHRKKYFLFPVLIVFFTASIGSFFLPKYYSSSVLILVQDEARAINPLAQQVYATIVSSTLVEQLKTLNEKILNYPQLRMVISSLGLDKSAQNPLELEKLIYKIQKKVEVKLRSSEVFEVSYEDKDPYMAERIVNKLVNSFIEYNIEKKKRMALIGVDFAESQAQVYSKQLEASENTLYEFRKEFPLQSPGKDTDINVSMLINYQTSLTSTQLGLREVEAELSRIESQLSGIETVQMNKELLEANPIINTLNEQLENAQFQLDDLLRNDPASSRVVEFQVRIDDLRRRLSEETEQNVDEQTSQVSPLLYQQLNQQKRGLENKLADFKSKESDFKKLVKEYEARISSLPEQDRRYANLIRDNRVNNNIYEMLRLKVEENRLDTIELLKRGIKYEVLAEGRIPLKPSKPRRLVIAVVSFILGILTGLGCVFLVELGDHSFRDVEDARLFLDVPVIGSTMKIMTQGEFLNARRKQRKSAVVLALVFFIFIIIAVTSSFIQERKLTERIVQEEMKRCR